jgi:hypothetical protein
MPVSTATRIEMIPPGEAAELLTRWAAPATNPGKAHAAIEKIRSLCDTAAATVAQVTPGATWACSTAFTNGSSRGVQRA